MKVINIGTASGLKSGLCKAFSAQDIKWCSVDRHLCINTSNNDAVSYIGPSVNHAGLQELCEACHLSECSFNSLRVSYSKL